MEKIKVKDIIDLIDYNREGTLLEVRDNDATSIINTGSMIMDVLADYQVACLSANGSRVIIGLDNEEFERRVTQH